MVYYTRYPCPIGQLIMTSDGHSLTGLGFQLPEAQWEQRDDLPIFHSVRSWLDGWFSGNPGPVDFPLCPVGTAFQQRVWGLLGQIPYGETVTYGFLAGQLGAKMSAQAVGQAVGKNPIALIIPCHRVVGAKGQLTGYAWGLERKKWLLRHEEVTK